MINSTEKNVADTTKTTKQNDVVENANPKLNTVKNELSQSDLDHVVGGAAPKQSFMSGYQLPKF